MNCIRIRKEHIKVLLLSLLCMYINHPFYLNSLEYVNKFIFYLFAILPLTGFFTFRIKIEAGMFRQLKYLIIYLFWVFLAVFSAKSGDLSYVTYLFRLLLGISAMYAFCIICTKQYTEGKIKTGIAEIYLISQIIYISGTIVFMFSPLLKEIWSRMIVLYGNADLISREEYVSRFGFSGFAGYLVSFQMNAGFVYAVYLLQSRKVPVRRGVFYLLFMMFGTTLYGRTGMLCAMVIFTICMLYLTVYQRRYAVLTYTVRFLLLAAAAGGILYPIFKETVSRYAGWAFELFINYIRSGKFYSLSGNEIKSFYRNFHPSADVLLHGTGKWMTEEGTYYGGTDVGFMRNIYFGGAAYTFFLYGLAVFFLILLYHRMRVSVQKGSRILVFSMFISFAVFELKGDVTFTFLKAYLPLYFYTLTEYHQKTIQI